MLGLIKTYALQGSLIALLAVGAYAGVQTWRLNSAKAEHKATLAEISRVSRETEAKRLAEAAERQRSHIEIDRKHYEDLQDAKTERDRLDAGISSGKYRVLVRAQCPAPSGLPAPGDSSGVDSGARAELAPASGRIVSHLREGAERHGAKLAACQEALRVELSR